MQKIAGYTNHWSYHSGPKNPDGGFSDAQWATIVREARAIVAAAEEKGIGVAGGQGSGRPVINDEMILLNGLGPQKYESFYLPKTPSEEDRRFHMRFMESFGEQPGQEVARGFCKTNLKPYDAVVASILAVAKRVGRGVFEATTDSGALKKVLASAHKYPAVVRDIESDYRRKAITQSERQELLDAVENAESLRDATRIVEQHRKGRVASRVAARHLGASVENSRMAAHRLDGVRGHQLLPASEARKLPVIYSQEDVKDPIVQVKLFSPYSGAVWYLTEYDPGSKEAFGWADLGYGMGELGYISIPELEGLNRGGLPLVERDTSWRPVPLSQAKRS